MKEGRKEGGRDSSHICAFDLFIPQHLIHPLLSWRGLFLKSISFLFPHFLFLFQRRNRDGSGGLIIFFSTRGRTETCAHNGRPASHVLPISHVFIEGGRENWEGLCISYLSIIIGKASKAKKDGKLEEEEEKKNPEPRNTLASRLFD